MRFPLSLSLPCAIALSFLCGKTTAADFVENGDLATDTAGWTGSGSWRRFVIDGDGMLALVADDLAPYYSAAGGNPATHATAYFTITGLTVNDSYDVAFDFGSVSGYYLAGTPDPLVSLSPGKIQMLVDNLPVSEELNAVTVQLIDPTAPAPLTYGSLGGTLQRATVNFIATAETVTLGWRSLEAPAGPVAPSVSNALLLLDNITITHIPVPEPTAALLTTLAAATGLLTRRHRPLRTAGK